MGNMKRFLENVNEEIAFLKRGIEAYRRFSACYTYGSCLSSSITEALCPACAWEQEAKERETQSDPTLLINILRNDE